MGKSKQISILVDEIDLAEIDGWAKLAGRSRNWTVGIIFANWIGSATAAKEFMLGVVSSKKIAEFFAGGGGAESGGTPYLSPLGKAQDGSFIYGPGNSIREIEESASAVANKFGDAMLKNLRASGVRREADKKIANGDVPEIGEPDTDVEMTTAELGRVGKIFGSGRRALPDGASCGHAGCLSHLSHQCEGCGRIGGRSPIYNMEDNAAQGKFLLTAAELKKIADESPGGFLTLSPEVLSVLRERAAVDGETAKVLHQDGLPLDREILVRWGLAENYKPITFENSRGVPGFEVTVNRTQVRPLVDKNKSEGVAVRLEKTSGSGTTFMAAKVPEATGNLEDEVGGGKIMEGNQGGEGRASTGKNRRVAKGLPKNDDGGKSIAVGVGKPKVDMAALRDICEGNFAKSPIDSWGASVSDFDTEQEAAALNAPIEFDLCGFKSYNEIDGENYVCGKEVHDSKVKHGEWLKV